MHTVDIEWTKTDSGRLIPIEIPGSEKIIAADMVLLALGFTGPEEGMIAELGLEQDERSNIKAEEGKYKTNVHGVFAAGDMRRGQSLVVWAIDEGRQAAREVDLFLMGETQLP
ncbi:Glutamate synthase [NADPH] small chain [compost metagenome]